MRQLSDAVVRGRRREGRAPRGDRTVVHRRAIASGPSRRSVLAGLGALLIASDARADAPILVGVYLSLSGSSEPFGRSTLNGIELATEALASLGGIAGRAVELRVIDDKGLHTDAATAVTRLVFDHGVVAILGEVVSSLSLSGARVAQAHGVPMISPASTNANVTSVGDRVFRACMIDHAQGRAAARFAREHLKARTAVVLYDAGSAYSETLEHAFVSSFVAQGGALVGRPLTYAGGDTDHGAQLRELRRLRPDVVYVPGYYTDAAVIARQAKALRLRAPLLGGDGWDSTQLAELAGDAIDGAYFTNHFAIDDPASAAFVTAYRARFGAEPDALAALGYDAARLLFDAIGRASSLDGADIAAAIAATAGFSATTGPLTMGPTRDPSRPAVVVRMRGGLPVYAATVSSD